MGIRHRVRTRIAKINKVYSGIIQRNISRRLRSRIKEAENATEGISDIKKRHSEFNDIRSKICDSGTDSLAHFNNGYVREGGLYLQQNPDEFASLCLYLKENGPYNNYMEIGSASGGACLFIYKQVGFANGISLDDGKHPRASHQKENFSQIPGLKQFVGDSHLPPAREFLESNVDGKFDVAFIDGDHSYSGVWQDIQLVLPFTRPGTIMIFHDTVACLGVEKAWVQCIEEKIIKPIAEYVGHDTPLGIGIGVII